MLPIFIHALIQAAGLTNDFVYPASSSYIVYVGIIYLFVWFFVLMYLFLDLNGWKRFKKPQAYLLIIGYAVLLTTLTILEYVIFASKWFTSDGIPAQNTTFFVLMSFAINIIGIFVFQFVYGSFVNIYSFKGGKTYTIHQLAFKTVFGFMLKRWSFFVDVNIKVDKNNYKNHSFILTRKALYLVDYFVVEYDKEIAFSEEEEKKEKIKGETKSLFTEGNFDLDKKIEIKQDVIDIFDDLNNSQIKYEFISPKIELEDNQEVLIKTLLKTSESEYIKKMISDNTEFLSHLTKKLRYDNLSVEDLPIINLVILDKLSSDVEPKGANEEFLIVKQEELFGKIAELEKFLPVVPSNDLNKIREVIRGK